MGDMWSGPCVCVCLFDDQDPKSKFASGPEIIWIG